MDDLTSALLASCYLPLFTSVQPPLFRGQRNCIDGGLSNNTPRVPQPFAGEEPHAVISPFYGRFDISPQRAPPVRFRRVRLFGYDVSFSNVRIGFRGIYPPEPSVLLGVYQQGHDDGLRYAETMASLSRGRGEAPAPGAPRPLPAPCKQHAQSRSR
jgi:hypothetical protein